MVCVLADTAWSSFRALLDGRTMDQRLGHFDPQTPPDAVDLVRYMGSAVVADHAADDPTVELAERAIREACVEANVPTRDTLLFLGASKGAVTLQCESADRFFHNQPLDRRHAEVVALGPHGYLGQALARRLGVRLHSQRVAACASGLAALNVARRWMLLPDLPPCPDTVIVATAESALIPYYIHSYRRLGVLAPATLDGYRQRPLDQRRHGFRLCQLASALVLKKVSPGSSASTSSNGSGGGGGSGGKRVELVDTALAAEAYDLVRPDPQMSALRHLAERLFAPAPVEVIHPHAPGTADHDKIELDVLCDVHRQRHGQPPAHAYAVKGALGHGLGAAGLSSLVVAAMALRSGRVPPMPWLTEPMADAPPGLSLSAAGVTTRRDAVHAIFAAGFGGHVAGATIRAGD